MSVGQIISCFPRETFSICPFKQIRVNVCGSQSQDMVLVLSIKTRYYFLFVFLLLFTLFLCLFKALTQNLFWEHNSFVAILFLKKAKNTRIDHMISTDHLTPRRTFTVHSKSSLKLFIGGGILQKNNVKH